MMRIARPVSPTLVTLLFAALAPLAIAAEDARPPAASWVSISDGVVAQLQKDGKKIGYPGLTAGVTVDPAGGDVYLVVCDQGLWKSTDAGKTFARVDRGTVGGRCETGFALNFDPAGKRLACFMIYGSSARSDDAGATWTAWKTSHVDFGAVDWEATGKAMLALRHESGGVLCLTTDAGATWKDLGRKGADGKVLREDRGFRALGMFDAQTLLASRGDGILRSTDGGDTWTKVDDAKLAAPVMQVRKGVGYWMTDKGVIASKDKGATWELLWPMKGMVFGPWFGKDDKHLVVVGKDGFSESKDGGASWKLAAPLPPGFNVGLVGPNYAWDVARDIFYASSMGKHTYKFERAAAR